LKHGRVLIWIICFALIATAQQSSITPESLRTWLTYLASDDLEGRATFSEGLGLAAAYIADQLKEAGVKPGGDHGSYFQRVEVLGIKSTNRSTVTVDVNGQKRTFKSGEGVQFPSNVGGKRTLTFNRIEFVGYGLNLGPDYNDYKSVDVKGKAVVWLGARGPSGTNPQQVARIIRERDSYAIEEMGAGAAIAPPPEPFSGQRGGGGRGGAQQSDFTTTARLDELINPSITSSDEFLDFLFSGSDVTYADLKAKAQRQEDLPKFALKGVSITFDLDADYQVVNTRYTRNVIGIVEGSDSRLKDTFVAFGAHYDHVGYAQGVLRNGQTDRINNGADDDGSGTATLIGLARAFARGPKIKRSEIFVWHAGEELGLYGSRYFADHPTVPLDHIVAQLNMDMIGRNKDNLETESNTVYTVGAERISTELHNIMINANASLATPMTFNFQLNDPSDPERVYYRSDHYSYASKGIPIIFFTTNLHPDYHRVTDEVDKILFDKMAHIAQLVYETGRRVANLDHAPIRDFKGPRLGRGAEGKILTSN
jgi:peptidase M28-like protein